MEAGLSDARSRSWHNYPGNAAPREAETPDFSPRQGRPGSFSRQLSSKIPVISAFPAHPPSPAPLPALSSGPLAGFSVRAVGSGFSGAATSPVWRQTGGYRMLLPSSGAGTLAHLLRLVEAVSSRHQRHILHMSKLPHTCRHFMFGMNIFSHHPRCPGPRLSKE